MTPDERIDIINQATNDIVNALGRALVRNKDITSEDTEIILAAVRGLATLLSVYCVSSVEISDNVGKMVALAERDMSAQIEAEAERLADLKADEKKTRSFIGKR